MDIQTISKTYGRALGARRTANAQALVEAVAMYPAAGLDQPHRLAQVLPQVFHESMAFYHVAELWGPTKAQLRYEGRDDLGNTEVGDGSRFRGYGLLQNTGRGNAKRFRDWCWAEGLPAPDFALYPEKQAEAPWSGLVVVWYWMTHDLNRFADDGNIEWITRKINGGLNGYAERLEWNWKAALVLLGYAPIVADVRRFQLAADLVVDGDVGPATRKAMHAALVRLNQAAAPVAVPIEQRLARIEARVGALDGLAA